MGRFNQRVCWTDPRTAMVQRALLTNCAAAQALLAGAAADTDGETEPSGGVLVPRIDQHRGLSSALPQSRLPRRGGNDPLQAPDPGAGVPIRGKLWAAEGCKMGRTTRNGGLFGFTDFCRRLTPPCRVFTCDTSSLISGRQRGGKKQLSRGGLDGQGAAL